MTQIRYFIVVILFYTQRLHCMCFPLLFTAKKFKSLCRWKLPVNTPDTFNFTPLLTKNDIYLTST